MSHGVVVSNSAFGLYAKMLVEVEVCRQLHMDIGILVGPREEIPKIIRRDHQQRRFTRLVEFMR